MKVPDPGEGWSQAQGQECKAKNEQECRAPVEEGRPRQEDQLPLDGPSSQQRLSCQPPARAWQCTSGLCHVSIHMKILQAATPAAVKVWARD